MHVIIYVCPKKGKRGVTCAFAQNDGFSSWSSCVRACVGSPPNNLIFYSKDKIDRGAYGVVYASKLADRAVTVKCIHKLLLEEHLAQGEQVLQDFQVECQSMRDISGHQISFQIHRCTHSKTRAVLSLWAKTVRKEDKPPTLSPSFNSQFCCPSSQLRQHTSCLLQSTPTHCALHS